MEHRYNPCAEVDLQYHGKAGERCNLQEITFLDYFLHKVEGPDPSFLDYFIGQVDDD